MIECAYPAIPIAITIFERNSLYNYEANCKATNKRKQNKNTRKETKGEKRVEEIAYNANWLSRSK